MYSYNKKPQTKVNDRLLTRSTAQTRAHNTFGLPEELWMIIFDKVVYYIANGPYENEIEDEDERVMDPSSIIKIYGNMLDTCKSWRRIIIGHIGVPLEVKVSKTSDRDKLERLIQRINEVAITGTWTYSLLFDGDLIPGVANYTIKKFITKLMPRLKSIVISMSDMEELNWILEFIFEQNPPLLDTIAIDPRYTTLKLDAPTKKMLQQFIQKSENLKNLQLKDSNSFRLLDALQPNRSVENVSLSSGTLNKECLDGLSKCLMLKKINLIYTSVDPESEDLLRLIEDNESLREINIYGFDKDYLVKIVKAFTNNKSLKSIKINGSVLFTEMNRVNLVKLFMEHPKLETFIYHNVSGDYDEFTSVSQELIDCLSTTSSMANKPNFYFVFDPPFKNRLQTYGCRSKKQSYRL
eukprot:TRINITY_DN774_c0_g1_i1.p1 TRINITY_DN774_c0_g1~~TRINITY_DN774_c0_g1_i1.p1  ORF type:complete len:409 (-),score=56.30 TRINITY_DN774_c0_g1_i1:67-1293(-)